jgi:hypothetical protein
MSAIDQIVNKFEPITLDQLNAVSLLQRVDTKYILPLSLLENVLNDLVTEQYILEINKQRKFEYLTHYYDTVDFKFYQHHHNGYVNRLKVRTRSYLDSNLNFFEIKHKERGTRTNKIRKVMEVLPEMLGNEEYDMIENKRYAGEKLELKMSNSFYRITLCNKAYTERITIDTDVRFFNGERIIKKPFLAIIEVKQGKNDYYSHTIQTLKKYQVRQASFSKYAVGIAMLEKQLKRNKFKPILLKLKKMELAHAG